MYYSYHIDTCQSIFFAAQKISIKLSACQMLQGKNADAASIGVFLDETIWVLRQPAFWHVLFTGRAPCKGRYTAASSVSCSGCGREGAEALPAQSKSAAEATQHSAMKTAQCRKNVSGKMYMTGSAT